uniref:DUF2971 domain-containing protein n=1 Tax=Prevotella sp. GTC17260 TaxID=3236796 RepID=A0AB33J6K0_9BACT
MCATICHYTTTQALNSILRRDGVYLWATHYEHLNDPNEHIWTQGAIKQFLMDKYKITESDLTELYSKYPYIISFCAIPDYMNMWRLYCNDGHGIMLEFDYNEIFKESEKHKRQTNNEDWDMFLGVTYSSLKDLNKMFSVAKRAYTQLYEDCDGIENDLGVCTFIKNEDYNIEDEIRYVRMKENDILFSEQGECIPYENKDGILYRMREAELISYTEIKFIPSAIKKIIVGYRLNFEKTCEGIHAILNQYGDVYGHLKDNIVPSQIGII